MKLIIAIPAFNEAEIIQEAVRTVYAILLALPYVDWSLVIADNGSNDGTAEKVLALALPRVTVLKVLGKGKGLAVRVAAASRGTDIFGFIDADLSADVSRIPVFVEKIASDSCDIAAGSRLLDRRTVRRGFFRTMSSILFNTLRRLLLDSDVSDSQCGMKFMNSRGMAQLQQCRENTWFFDMELLFLAERNHLRILEIPVAWEEFRYRGRKSKINLLRDGIDSILAMMRIRLRYMK